MEREMRRLPKFLIILLTAVAVAELGFYAGAGAAPWLEARSWYFRTDTTRSRIRRWRCEQYRPDQDPPAGLDLPAVSLPTPEGRPLPLVDGRTAWTVILFVDDPESCGTKSLLATWSRLRKSPAQLRILVVARRVAKARDPLCRRPMPPVTIVGDPGGHLAQLLNAGWRPRAYLADRGGRVRYLQPDDRLDGEAAADAARWISGSL